MQRADQRKHHYIYKITRNDGRYYIGMHSTDDTNDGYFGSGKRITRSIKKHGKERHSREILETLPTRKLLKKREKELLTEELRADPMCMNIAPGGGGGFINELHRQKFIASSRTAALKGTDRASEIARKAHATRRKNGTQPAVSCNWAGRKHSDEAKAKMAASGAGHKNSQFGSCWVTNGSPIKIKVDQLDEYLAKGYSRGRKLR